MPCAQWPVPEEKLRRSYERDGFVAMPGFFAAGTMDVVAGAVERLPAIIGPLQPGMPRAGVERIGDDYRIKFAAPIVDLAPEFAALARHESVRGLFTGLFGEEPRLF